MEIELQKIKRLYPNLEYPERYSLGPNDELIYNSVHDGPAIDAGVTRIVSGDLDDLTDRAESAANRASGSELAIKNAIDKIPPGATVVINDLTTGGAAAALSAEQGKALDGKKANTDWVATQLSKKAYEGSVQLYSGNTTLTPASTGFATLVAFMGDYRLTKGTGFFGNFSGFADLPSTAVYNIAARMGQYGTIWDVDASVPFGQLRLLGHPP